MNPRRRTSGRHRASERTNVVPFRPHARPATRGKRSKPGNWALWLLVASPLVGIGVAWGWHTVGTHPGIAGLLPQRSHTTEQYHQQFAECSGPIRRNCVVDGDTFWLQGEKIRIADINTPEVSEPQCQREADLGDQATKRLIALLNEGGFSLATIDRDEDRYGRKLRIVTRSGESLGETLVAEGLAERWKGYRGGWC